MKKVVILLIVTVLVFALSLPALSQTEAKYIVSGNGTMDDNFSFSLAIAATYPSLTPSGHLRIHGLNCVAIEAKIDCTVSPAATFTCNNPAGPSFTVDVSTGGPGEGTIILHGSSEDQTFTVREGSINCGEVGGETN